MIMGIMLMTIMGVIIILIRTMSLLAMMIVTKHVKKTKKQFRFYVEARYFDI